MNCVNCGSSCLSSETTNCDLCGRPKVLDDLDYLNAIERLAHAVVEAGMQSKLIAFSVLEKDGQFEQRLSQLAQHLRHYHYKGDGCVDDESSSHGEQASVFAPHDSIEGFDGVTLLDHESGDDDKLGD